MNNIPKVWVIQEGKNDYAPAEKFGEVNFITQSDLRSMEGSEQNRKVYSDIKRFKSTYLVGTDYLIIVGNPMVSTLVIMTLGMGDHKFLKWDGRRAEYICFKLNSNNVK